MVNEYAVILRRSAFTVHLRFAYQPEANRERQDYIEA
jgi:hypothetical protein